MIARVCTLLVVVGLAALVMFFTVSEMVDSADPDLAISNGTPDPAVPAESALPVEPAPPAAQPDRARRADVPENPAEHTSLDDDAALKPADRKAVCLDIQLITMPSGELLADTWISLDGNRLRTDSAGQVRHELGDLDQARLSELLRGRRSSRVYAGFTVSAEGHVTARVNLSLTALDRVEPVVVKLFASSSVTAFVRTAAYRPLAGARVSAMARAGPRSPDRGVQVRLARVLPGTTDRLGRAQLTNLPAGVPVTVSIRAGVTDSFRARKTLELAPGEVRTLEWTLLRCVTLVGQVVDQFQKPVGGASVWLFGQKGSFGGRSSGRLGEFAFHGVPPGRYRLEVEADVSRDGFAPAVAEVDLTEDGIEKSHRITVHRGLFIEGRVENPEGAPLAGIRVASGRSEGDYFGYYGVETETGEHGAFRLGPLRPGRHQIQADGPVGFTNSAPVEVAAGSAGVVLRVRRAAALEGRVVDSVAGRPAEAEVRAYLRSRWTWFTASSDRVDGTFEISDLPPGDYDLEAVSEAGSVSRLGPVSLGEGETRRGLELALAPGATLVARLGLPEPAGQSGRSFKQRFRWTVVQGGALIHTDLVKTVETEIPVPPGRVEVRLVRLEDERLIDKRLVETIAGRRTEVRFHLPP